MVIMAVLKSKTVRSFWFKLRWVGVDRFEVSHTRSFLSNLRTACRRYRLAGWEGE